ncbi:MAG: hypothetical protein ACTSVZ_06800 [Promethearchaeota archaeon]
MRKDWRDFLYSLIVGLPLFIVLILLYNREILTLEVMGIIAIVYVIITHILWFFWLKPRILGRGS